jgi:hypothetical protein
MPQELSERDHELIQKTRREHKVDLVLDTTDADWLKRAKQKSRTEPTNSKEETK